MDILEKHVAAEISVKNSRFLAELIPCSTQNGARALIKAQKEKYRDATHVVHAFIIGKSAEILGMSDDGEPSGTAGRPVLDVLKGQGFTNAVLTVTRWFGGTLLGTGGLVKAYSASAKEVTEKARAEGAIVPLVEYTEFSITADYSLHGPLLHEFEKWHIKDITEEFATEVKICGKIRTDEYNAFRNNFSRFFT